jgi:hypothetical protein
MALSFTLYEDAAIEGYWNDAKSDSSLYMVL